MPTIALVYFSQGGSTHLLAEQIAAGARQSGQAELRLIRLHGHQVHEGRWQDDTVLARLSEADLIVFGVPTFMGGPAAQFKAFADATAGLWFARAWTGKLAAGFTTSGSPSGDKLATLSYLSVLAAQHGMHWLSWDALPYQPDGTNHLGSFLGLMGHNLANPGEAPVLSEADARSAQRFGEHLARTAQRLSPQPAALPA
ncbi:flavodoxin family protein [Ideonella azotifigens]|uniref:Flavoprotein WrbA n=1 Tax=Ideonella azotifigens TaxID=513160 RepID=A0ABP3USC6_9BURK|nr:flavodoxin family protein [Ideonella azotifigens]MCD2341862.1 flavodoxin family protein [Ideonella azotifigens]